MGLAEQDGSFRRLVEAVREQQSLPLSGRPGRPPKNRVPTTGHFALPFYNRMRTLARLQTEQSGHVVSISDLYNEAASIFITDLHVLLGDDLRLPAGALTLPGVLVLRELVDRPILTPLQELGLTATSTQRTTLYFDPIIWDALIEVTLRFGLRMRRVIHIHRLLELSSVWYLAGVETPAAS
jgi:hypothetical protein